MASRPVNIYLTTIETELRAGVTFNPNHAEIVISGNKCKTDHDIIEAIAHEITHVLMNSQQHGHDFNEQMKTNRQAIYNQYFKELREPGNNK